MIRATAFLDPLGYRPRMEFIGGPWDGETARAPHPEQAPGVKPELLLGNDYLRDRYNGEYVFADLVEWSYVWVPLLERGRE
jgi:hypothetical protein